MKEITIFLMIFLIIFAFLVFIFNGRFIYAQIKYAVIGMPPISDVYGDDTFSRNVEEKFYPEEIIIPTINLQAPVILAGDGNENYLQKLLEKGVIYLAGSSALNEKGVGVIMGHSSAYPWYQGQYGSIFALLDKLSIGDEIIIKAKNKRFLYQVLEKEIKAPKDLLFEKSDNQSILYLVSCWPVNTAWKRIVIKTGHAIDKN
jgi:LPXTG-site transpeptidase (sortase) family protein